MTAPAAQPRRFEPRELAEVIKARCGEERSKREAKVVFLIGAGFSVSAGIPAAGAVVDTHLRKHRLLRKVGKRPAWRSEYAHLMQHLEAADRVEVIRGLVRKASVGEPPRTPLNWAHLLLATMVETGYVKLILTTNFDPLLIDAMALTDQPIQVYDLTATEQFVAGDLDRGTIIYLHGQASGLLQAHTDAEMERVRRHLRTVFNEALRDSVLVVVGYSGSCDPVLHELDSNFRQFARGLYWSHYSPSGELPVAAVSEMVAQADRGARLCERLDADQFMYKLVVDGLGEPLLPLIQNPLQHLRRVLARVTTPPKFDGEAPRDNPVEKALAVLKSAEARGKVKSASATKSELAALELDVSLARLTADEVKLDALRRRVAATSSPKLAEELAAAYSEAAWRAIERKDVVTAIRLLKHADRLGLKSAWHLATWGIALAEQAKAELDPARSTTLFQRAAEKHASAIALSPGMHEALSNWGVLLAYQARAEKDTARQVQLFGQAAEKFAQALKITPDKHGTLNNWGLLLMDQARIEKDIARQAQLFGQAEEKFAQALKIKPDRLGALNNWGLVLLDQARAEKDIARKAQLFGQAGEQFSQALKIKPEKHEVLYNLACLDGLQGDADRAAVWLRRWRDVHPSPSRKEVDDDADFDSVRTALKFLEVRATLPP